MGTMGFFTAMRSRFERNRLGELLVQRGKLTPEQLHQALKHQKETGKQLGSILQELHFTSKGQIRTTLMEQASYRALAAMFTLFIGVSAFSPFGAKASPLNSIRPSAAGEQQQTMVYKAAYHPNDITTIAPSPDRSAPLIYPRLFGSKEVPSTDISAFKKWTEVLARLDHINFDPPQVEQFRSMPLNARVAAVNDYVNTIPYIEDKDNYGKSDYWATPDEFFARGGDCEDFAIAKYALLKTLGVSEDHMRLAIVQDTVKNIPHAILIVYTENGAMVLDNQTKKAKQMASVTRYKPIYSINATGWWRHLS